MKEVTVTFENVELNFSIFTNVPDKELESCLDNWEARNYGNLNAESLVKYINSKTYMTGNKAEVIE